MIAYIAHRPGLAGTSSSSRDVAIAPLRPRTCSATQVAVRSRTPLIDYWSADSSFPQ
eukprot:COSAG06_NODE_11099_length_1567_cov_0.868529_2_plen_56_part_01